MSEITGAYNAVTYLLDRNIDEGRASKLAYTDTVSELTYGELQRQSCRVANMLRRLGVRREERVAMILLDTVDFPTVFLGAIKAGIVPVPLNTLLDADDYRWILANSLATAVVVSGELSHHWTDIAAAFPGVSFIFGGEGPGPSLDELLAAASPLREAAGTH